MKKLFGEWRETGKGIEALLYFVFAVLLVFVMAILGCFRLFVSGERWAALAYFTLSALALTLTLCVVRFVRRNEAGRVSTLGYPLVVVGFIFGLTALFFIDGGATSGVPVMFIFALALTPCLLKPAEGALMLGVEFLAYGTNFYMAFKYPESVWINTIKDMSFLFPLGLVALSLGVLTLVAAYVLQRQDVRLDQAIEAANAANAAKSAFLDNMSHEIRTPMNSILGMNEMILREESRPEIVEYALTIQRSGRALLGIINDILDFSKIQDNRMEIVPIHYDLTSLINDMVSIGADQAKKKSLDFSVNIDKAIPRMLNGDEFHVRQVILNILNNAVKFTEHGGITLNLGYEKQDNSTILLKCSVSDTGIGIKEEDMEFIFKPFEQVASTMKLHSDGSGLGLAIVRNLLQLMGSELRVESVYRKGSTFSFEVPQTVMKWEPIGNYDRAFSLASSSQAEYHEPFRAPNARVLVVDDAEVNIVVFSNLLKNTRIKIDKAYSGSEMLQMVRMSHYDMIFLDHRMPGMDGVEAFHAMKALPNNLNERTPVIAFTANAVLGARQMYLDEGFDDYISKPIDTVRLEQLLLSYLPPEKIERSGEEASPEAEIRAPEPAYKEPKPEEFEDEDELEEEEASPYASIPGIDYDAAVTNCGSEDTFVAALQIFYDTLDQKAGDIEKFEREKDIKNYTILVHALKSAARLVGALQLSADAKYLEDCGNAQNVEEIEAKTPKLLSDFRGYKEVLAPLFGTSEEEDMSLPEISVDELHELYSLIKGLAAEFDLDNIDKMMEEAKSYRIPEAEKERFNKLKDCVRSADWATLEQLLEAV
ncbi:MAG: response regulator [Synergistaceae bacterium]|nr:response regulator [Synergistaceae bacterium]